MGWEGEELRPEWQARSAGRGLSLDLRLGLVRPRPWTLQMREVAGTGWTSVAEAGHRRR